MNNTLDYRTMPVFGTVLYFLYKLIGGIIMRVHYNEVSNVEGMKLEDFYTTDESLMSKSEAIEVVEEMTSVYIRELDTGNGFIDTLVMETSDGEQILNCLDKRVIAKFNKTLMNELLVNGYTDMAEFLFIDDDELNILLEKRDNKAESSNATEDDEYNRYEDNYDDEDEGFTLYEKLTKPFHDI